MASILETFYFLFESDADKLDKGLKESERKSEALERSLKDTDKAADMVGGSLLNLARSAGAVIGSFLAFAVVKATVMETAAAIDDLGDAAAAFDLPVEKLSAWSMAATAVDGTQQGFIGSLQALNTGIVAIATTGKGRLLPFLEELGLSMTDIKRAAKDPTIALELMADKFKGLTRAEAAGLGSKIGLDQGTINLLSQGRRGIDELLVKQRELGVVTTAQAEAAGDFDLAMKEWNATFADVKRELVVSLLPSITWFFDKLRQIVAWMSEHKVAVVAFFGAVAAVLLGVYTPAAVTAAAATWAMLAPFLAIAIPLAAFSALLALVVDDLYSFMEGNDSVIGEVAKKWPIIGELIRDLGDRLAWAIAVLQAFGQFFVDMIEHGPIVALQNMGDTFIGIIEDIMRKYPAVGATFDAVSAVMSASIERVVSIWDFLVAKITAGVELFKSAAGVLKGLFSATPLGAAMSFGVDAASALGAGKRAIASTNSPIAAQTSSSISNSSTTQSKATTVQTGPITVNTQASDGAQVASALGKELGTQLRGAIDQNDDGVVA